MPKMFPELSSDMKGQNPERYPCIILHIRKDFVSTNIHRLDFINR